MRLSKLRQAMAKLDLDAIVISRPENLRYLSGFTGGEGYLIVTADQALVATDFRYYDQVEREAPGWTLAKMNEGFEKLMPGLLPTLKAQRIGFEAQVVTYEQYQKWTEAITGCQWVATSEVVEKIRSQKEPVELEHIRRAVDIADASLNYVMGLIKPGMTEREIGWELEAHMRTHGAENVGFTFIIASGPNAALPHAVTSDRPIQAGEPITIDMGAKVAGYCSDMTRTFCLGQPKDDTYMKVWNTVFRAQQTACETIRAGMSGVDAHMVAHKIIEDAGYGAYFGHGLGHGVGLAIHEKPRLSRLSKDILAVGDVVTVEPGIYLPSWGGVRIEDMGVITEQGLDNFTKSAKIAIVS